MVSPETVLNELSGRANKRGVIAVGGNALIKNPARKTLLDQYVALQECCYHIYQMIQMGWEVVITHGNGPQAGYILERSDRCLSFLHPVPLDYCNADTEGSIGYMIQQILYNISGGKLKAQTVISQVVVAADDPEWQKPTKPVGSFYSLEEATRISQIAGWMDMKEDPQARGWRRVVPSPQPLEIIEIEQIRQSLNAGFVVVAVGGGGVPVTRQEGRLIGAEAVIDKDKASALLAPKVDADLLFISTEVPAVSLNFRKDDQRRIRSMSVEAAEEYYQQGQFPPGNMGPKIWSIIRFLKEGGKAGIITDPPNIPAALKGEIGTLIAPDCETTFWE